MADVKDFSTRTRIVRRTEGSSTRRLETDVCVVGAGIAGVSAALEAAALGRRVVLVDGLPALGGQAVNSIIGTFCGLFANGTHGEQLTFGIAEDILRDLGASGDLHYRHGPMTTVVMYDEIALGRWVEESVRKAGIQVLTGAVMRTPVVEGRRVQEVGFATRYGDVDIRARGWVDATGDAALSYESGMACREPADGPIYGTQMVVLEHIDEDRLPPRDDVPARAREVADVYGLDRTDGFAFKFPGRGTALINLTHIETPLDPVEFSTIALEGKAQADRSVEFLKQEFPEAFGSSRVRTYGYPGIRMTRWIVGEHQLTVDEVRDGTEFPDSILRTAWPIELHDHKQGYVWEPFDEDHLHHVPMRSLLSPEADNIVAAGRCIDGDAAALSSVRVMGPCIAMGAAAANTLDLADGGNVHEVPDADLRGRLARNLGLDQG
jgi:hypothetical protein